jgi:acylphosphatase
MSPTEALVARERMRIRVKGAVQGLGFRPFVDGLAVRCGLSGSRNMPVFALKSA